MTSSLFGFTLYSLLTSALFVFCLSFNRLLLHASPPDEIFSSSSFLQVTLAPSWWSIRKKCTSLQTVGRHGDRYITSSLFADPILTFSTLSPCSPWRDILYISPVFFYCGLYNFNVPFLKKNKNLDDFEISPNPFWLLVLKVFEEEHHILYLDHGGVIVAIKDTSIPLKILK